MKRFTTRTVGHLMAMFVATHVLSSNAAPPLEQTVQGRLAHITKTEIKIDDDKHFPFDPSAAQCFDFRGDRTTCETLIGIGYADKARITLVGGLVKRVDILELQQ